MANELHAHTTTGLTIYAVLLNSVGQIYNGTTFVTINGANWTTYDIAMTEATAGIYLANMPSVTGGVYSYAAYQQAGANPAITDTLKTTGSIQWDGSAELSFHDLMDVLDTASITVVSAISGDTLSVTIGATYEATVSGLTISATWTKIYFTIKSEKESQIDSAAIIQIVETNPAAVTDGLLYFNGAAGTAANASLTVNQAAGTVAIKILDEATDDLAEARGLEWDIKVLEADGDSAIAAQGMCGVSWTPTRAVA
jgi:hypothetical protein